MIELTYLLHFSSNVLTNLGIALGAVLQNFLWDKVVMDAMMLIFVLVSHHVLLPLKCSVQHGILAPGLMVPVRRYNGGVV